MNDPDTIITTMAQQREQERAQDETHYKLRKACQARAVELYEALWKLNNEAAGGVELARPCVGNTNTRCILDRINAAEALLKEIDDATQ